MYFENVKKSNEMLNLVNFFRLVKYHQQSKNYEKSLKYLNMGFTGMFSVETILKIIGFGVKVGATNYQPVESRFLFRILTRAMRRSVTRISNDLTFEPLQWLTYRIELNLW